jgi:polysaccharide biosynthesis protein PelD
MDTHPERDVRAVLQQGSPPPSRAALPVSPEAAPPWQAWVEIAVLAGAAVAIGAVVDHRDPVLAQRPVPWLAIAPLLAGLRYGAGLGIACAAAQAAALLAAAWWRGSWVQGPLAEIVLGWLVAGLVSGEFRDAWVRRTRQLEARAGELRLRLEGLSRAYHVMKASHDRLTRDAPGRPSSLRDALGAFLTESAEAGSIEVLADRILAVFRDHAFVRGATLHAIDAEGEPGPALAALGAEAAGARGDPILRRAARAGGVVSVHDLPEATGIIAAVPLVDVSGQVHAVVGVHELPFVALHEETLALLAVLGGHFGDALSRMPVAREERQPSGFWSSLRRSVRDTGLYGIPASLAMVQIEAAPGELPSARLLARHVAIHRRLTDEAEILADARGNPLAFILLRLTDEAGMESYLARVERLARMRAEELGARGEIRVRGWPLDEARFPDHPGVEAFLAALREVRAGPICADAERDHGAVA